MPKLSTIALQKEPFNHPFSKQDSINQRVDPLGERDVFYERDQINAINRRILTDAKDEVTIMPDLKTGGLPLSDLNHAYLDHEPAYVPDVSREYNYWIPDFSRLDAQCNAVYRQTMSSTYAMNELKTYYNEKCETLYHFTLSKFMILNQMAKYGIASRDQVDFVEQFRMAFPPENLPVSGLYRGFYIGLNSATPEDNRFAEVIPYLPPVAAMELTAANNQLAPCPLFSMMPNFAALIRILHQQGGEHPPPQAHYQVSTYENDNNIWGDNFIWDYPNPNQNDAWTGNRMLTWRRWTPGLQNVACRCRSMQDIGDYTYNPLFPRPSYRDVTQDIENEFQEMGFQNGFNWFESLVSIQQRVTRYWHDPSTLADLMKPSTGYGLYVNRIRPRMNENTFDAYNDAHRPANVAADLATVNAIITNFQGLGIQAAVAPAQPTPIQQTWMNMIQPYRQRRAALMLEQARAAPNDEQAVFEVVNPIRIENPMVPPFLRTEMYQEIRESQIHKENQIGAEITNWNTENLVAEASELRGIELPNDMELYHGRYWDIVRTYRSSSFELGRRLRMVPGMPSVFIVKPQDLKST